MLFLDDFLCALRGSTGSPRPEPVEGRASAMQTPSPASHKSLKNPKIRGRPVARQAKKILATGKRVLLKVLRLEPDRDVAILQVRGSPERAAAPAVFGGQQVVDKSELLADIATDSDSVG